MIVGNDVVCDECIEPLEPSDDGTRCIHDHCLFADPEDRMKCLECEPGFFMAWDTTKCYATCPPDRYVAFNDMQHPYEICGPICEDDEYRIMEDKMCGACNVVDGCLTCMETPGEESVHCLTCSNSIDDMLRQPTYDGFRCSVCEIDSYELEDGTCEYCWDRFDFCGSCTENGEDPWHCNRCLGDIDWIYDENTNE